MHFVCAPDSFKESMSAAVAAKAMERGIRNVFPDASVALKPMADGGEGTCETLASAMGAETEIVACHDALNRPIQGRIAYAADRSLAIIEVAEACGLEKLGALERDPLITTSKGVGELIKAALDLGATSLIVGLGGSATNDAGAGMMCALGARFLDGRGHELPPGGAALRDLSVIDLRGLDPRLQDVMVCVVSDVSNPLTGPNGASAVFAPQKGADASGALVLEDALTRWADVVHRTLEREVRNVSGAGAAGGLGAALIAFFNGTIEPGAGLIMEVIGLKEEVAGATAVFTGEGKLDLQSVEGKVPVSVANLAGRCGVPTVIFAGKIDSAIEGVIPEGVVAIVPIVRDVGGLAEALLDGEQNLEQAVSMVCRLLAVNIDWLGKTFRHS